MNILILNKGKNFSNWGIRATTDALESYFKKIFPEAQINGIDHSYFNTNFSFDPTIFGKKLFNRNSRILSKYSRAPITAPLVFDDFPIYQELWNQNQISKFSKKLKSQLELSDIIVFNAEGSTYRANKSAIKALFLLWYAKLVLKKKCIFINGSVTLTTIDSVLNPIVYNVFKSIDLVYIREKSSLLNINQYFDNINNVTLLPDLVFYDHKYKQTHFNIEEPYFCVSSSMLPMSKNSPSHGIINVIKKLSQSFGKPVILCIDKEDQYIKKYTNYLNAIIIDHKYNYNDVINIINNSQFLFSGRYHHLIFAIITCTPIIPMDTSSHKIRGLMKFFDYNYKIFDPTDLNYRIDEIIFSAGHAISNLKIYADNVTHLRKQFWY